MTNQKLPPQHQHIQPGKESRMTPAPEFEREIHVGTGKLKNKIALVTGGDSGIGRAVAVLFAKEGCDVAISYLNEHEDAQETKKQVEQEGRKALLLPGDIGDEHFCKEIVEKTQTGLGHINILVNNAAEQHPKDNLESITAQQLEKTFRTNIFSFFYLSKFVVPHMKKGDCIINTTSVTAYRGSEHLLDYSSTKGAIVTFTRSLALNLASKGIRVNAVAPGPIWTPLIPSTFPAEHVESFGSDVPLGRVGQPEEVAPAFLFLACDDTSYMSGQVLHPNGGEIING